MTEMTRESWRDLIDSYLPQTSVKARLGGFREQPTGPDELTPEAVQAWILNTAAKLGMSPTTLAKKADLAPSTINRFLSAKRTHKNVGARTIAKLVATAEKLVAEAADTKMDSLESALLEAVSAPIYIAGQASSEGAAKFLGRTRRYTMSALVPSAFRRSRLFGIEVADSHADSIYEPSSIVVVCPIDDLGREPRSGERVCFHSWEADAGYVTMVRELRISPNNDAWLIGLSRIEPSGTSLSQTSTRRSQARHRRLFPAF
jgi:hypothetical protein